MAVVAGQIRFHQVAPDALRLGRGTAGDNEDVGSQPLESGGRNE
jgi:hypothetical protein